MKKLTIVLFLLLFNLSGNAQIEWTDDYSFTKDKKWHTGVSAVESVGIFTVTYCKTKDEDVAFMAGFIIPSITGIAWEGLWFMTGKEISLSDMTYNTISALGTSTLMYCGIKLGKRIKRKIRMRRIYKEIEYDLSYEIWSLDNEFINNK